MKQTQMRGEKVEDVLKLIPNDCEEGVVYLDNNCGFYECPCGCGSHHMFQIDNELNKEVKRPKWAAEIKDGKIHMTPSVRCLSGCKSHFNFTNGEVVWHADSGK